MPERAGPQVPGGKKRLLVVDDEAGIGELLALYFKLKGLEVTTLQSTVAAIAQIEQGNFDLLILDWHLDGTDGLDLLNLSKAMHPGLPVIVFTGDSDDQSLLRTALAGRADAVVRKIGSLDALAHEVFSRILGQALCAGK
jgi:DNA-binding response OmpR family regulator